VAISILAVTMKREIAASACSLLAMTRQDSPAVRAPTSLKAMHWMQHRPGIQPPESPDSRLRGNDEVM